jgi:hypothetical protein
MVYVIEVLKAMGRPTWAEGYACARPARSVRLAAVVEGWLEVLQGDQRRPPGMLGGGAGLNSLRPRAGQVHTRIQQRIAFGRFRNTTGHGDSRRTTCAGLCLHALRALLAGSACSACYHACQASMQRACRLLRQSFSHGWGVQLRALYLIAEASIALHGSCGCLRPDAALLVRYAGYASQVWSAVQHGTPLRRLSRFRLWLTHAGLAQVDACSSRSA